jgi:tetratricopeptide (TPR) repeat protein
LGKNFEDSGEIEKAEAIYKELMQVQPWNQKFLLALNAVYLQQKNYDASIALLEKSIQLNRNDINAFGMLGTTYFIKDNREKAFEVWDEALTVISGNHIAYRIIANHAIENRAFDKAVEILEKGKEVSNDPKLFAFDLANIHTANMKYKEATDEYCYLLLSQPMQLETVKRRVDTFLERPGAAEAVEESILKNLAGNDNNTLKEFLAYIFVVENKFDEALELIIEIDKNTRSNGGAVYRFAQELFNGKHYETSAKCFNYIIENNSSSPVYPPAKIGYAKTLELTVDLGADTGRANWKEYSNIDTSKIELYLPVINAYKEIAELYPSENIGVEAMFRTAKIQFLKQRRAPGAVKILTDIILNKRMPLYSIRAFELLGDINIYNGNIDEALVNYKNAYKLKDVDINREKRIISKIANLYFWKGEFSKSIENLNKIIKHLNDDNANNALELALVINMNKQDSVNLVLYSEALLLAEQCKFEKAAEIFMELSGKGLMFLSKLSSHKYAQMLTALDKYPEALEILNNLVDEDKSGINADKSLFLCGQIYQFGLNESQKALSYYKRILENFPNSIYYDKSRNLIQTLQNNNGKTI